MTNDVQIDFEKFLLEKDWRNARAVIDAVEEYDEVGATEMYEALNRARAFASNEAEDIGRGHEDPRDIADRTNSGL